MTAYTSAPALGYFQATASIFAKNVAKERIGFSLSSRTLQLLTDSVAVQESP